MTPFHISRSFPMLFPLPGMSLTFSDCFLERQRSKKTLISLDRAFCPAAGPHYPPFHRSQSPGWPVLASSACLSVSCKSLAASWVQFISRCPVPSPSAPLSEPESSPLGLLRCILLEVVGGMNGHPRGRTESFSPTPTFLLPHLWFCKVSEPGSLDQ